jgi:hypothetical protein
MRGMEQTNTTEARPPDVWVAEGGASGVGPKFGVANNYCRGDIALIAGGVFDCHRACYSGTGTTLPRRFRLGMIVLTAWGEQTGPLGSGAAREVEDKEGMGRGQWAVQCRTGAGHSGSKVGRQAVQNGDLESCGKRRDSRQGSASKRFHPDELDDGCMGGGTVWQRPCAIVREQSWLSRRKMERLWKAWRRMTLHAKRPARRGAQRGAHCLFAAASPTSVGGPGAGVGGA